MSENNKIKKYTEMKFKVASKALYSTLSGVSKVINTKNTISILDNFLW